MGEASFWSTSWKPASIPLLAQHIVRQFNDPVTNPRNAQLIFTTHDTNLLGTSVGEPALRRDQVWLTEKDNEGATVLYPLTDYKPRKAENLERGYLQGRYGAIPFLGDFHVSGEVSTTRDGVSRHAEPSPRPRAQAGSANAISRAPADHPHRLRRGEDRARLLPWVRDACRNPRVRIEIAPEHGVPRTLVIIARDHKKRAEKAAKQERDENLAYDSVWCVFDVDDHPNLPDAQQMARDNRIDLAISNPCFELWLLLHFRESPGMQPRETIRKMLSSHVPGYDKRVEYPAFSGGYRHAIERAKQLKNLADSASASGAIRRPASIGSRRSSNPGEWNTGIRKGSRGRRSDRRSR